MDEDDSGMIEWMIVESTEFRRLMARVFNILIPHVVSSVHSTGDISSSHSPASSHVWRTFQQSRRGVRFKLDAAR
ncbi:hypothetical protein E2C01_062882 [Portunus trituberculatus]|uniref:Uncharacterized protein n=1 Tax=Portunus trituberculatus TaxID=210409 RepID=A0A5B7HIS7_PORTR|nr:hypothetical protein [Portunus trituberculatus]